LEFHRFVAKPRIERAIVNEDCVTN
jgi:hypothetical protein